MRLWNTRIKPYALKPKVLWLSVAACGRWWTNWAEPDEKCPRDSVLGVWCLEFSPREGEQCRKLILIKTVSFSRHACPRHRIKPFPWVWQCKQTSGALGSSCERWSRWALVCKQSVLCVRWHSVCRRTGASVMPDPVKALQNHLFFRKLINWLFFLIQWRMTSCTVTYGSSASVGFISYLLLLQSACDLKPQFCLWGCCLQPLPTRTPLAFPPVCTKESQGMDK